MEKTVEWKQRCRSIVTLVGVIFLLSCTQGKQPQELKHNDQLLLMCESSCNDLTTEITQLGGQINRKYSSINAIAVTIPAKFADQFSRLKGIKSIRKDELIPVPKPVKSQSIANKSQVSFHRLSHTNRTVTNPNNYNFNNVMTGATQMHQNGISGDGVIVAVIDSGTANNSEVVPALAGSVIGGESFIDLADEPSATSTANDFHGTAVGSMIAAHVGIVLDNNSELIQTVTNHAPDSVIPVDDLSSMIPMVGSAPGASLYAMKVFAASGESTPSSIVLAAMDRALTLKRNFNAGVPSEPVSGDGSEDNPYVYDSLNIQVVNLSLGGLGMVAGLELEEILAREMLSEGINVVASAGNDGFASLTVGSPGSSVATITVGPTMTPQHERILRDLTLGAGMGEIFRPNNIVQGAYFSSRGPTADGRHGVNVMANGYAAFVQGADGGLMLISGTSFAAPTVAGATALLRQASPDSAAAQIREALIQGANPLILPHDSVIDQGTGFIDLAKAQTLLGTAGSQIPPLPQITEDEPVKVMENLQALELDVIQLDHIPFETIVNLQPGQPLHLLVESKLITDSISFEFSDVTAELPAEQQNQLFDDAILFNVADGPVSVNNFVLDERVLEDQQFVLQQPQTGLVRAALIGDWTNAGAMTAKITIRQKQRRLTDPYKEGKLRDDETDAFLLAVDDNILQLNFELSWEGDWGHYPPHDIDLILIDPAGEPYFDAATLDAPERMSIDAPLKGDWTVIVTGYMLHGFKDKYELRITDQRNRPLHRDDD